MKLKELIAQINVSYRIKGFLVIGITGSVAVGKSTFAKDLAKRLSQQVAVVSTDHFIMSNAELEQTDLFAQKGFPKTYHLDQLQAMIQAFRNGQQEYTIPLYEQNKADITGQQSIQRPEILVIEGVSALQIAAKYYDLALFIEANMDDITNWYLTRTVNFIHAAKNQPDSWYYPYSQWTDDEIVARGLEVWKATNLPNFEQNILPTREKADYIIKKNSQHQVVGIKSK